MIPLLLPSGHFVVFQYALPPSSYYLTHVMGCFSKLGPETPNALSQFRFLALPTKWSEFRPPVLVAAFAFASCQVCLAPLQVRLH